MCAPLIPLATAAAANPVTPFVLTAASTGVGVYGQYQQASAQADYQKQLAIAQNEQIELNAKYANENYRNQLIQASRQELEAEQSDSQAVLDNQLKAAQARATARVAAGEAGVSGLSVDALLYDFYQQEARFRDSVRLNAENRKKFGQSQLDALRSQTEQRINSIRPFTPSPIEQPNFAAAALRLGSDSLDIYTQQQRDKKV